MKLLLYCTKGNKYERLVRDEHYGKPFYLCGAITKNFESLNGKIVEECDFEVEKIEAQFNAVDYEVIKEFKTKTMLDIELYKRSCLFGSQIDDYLKGKNGYAIHIKNLHIFDEPKELSEVYSIKDIGGGLLVTEPLKKAPQNMMRVSINKWDYGCANFDDIRIVISIRPQWMCLILNRIKDVEVRRVVLKEMLKCI